MAEIALSASIRANLLSLQRTDSLAQRTQTRLATGQKVNSAIDDAVAFFAAKALSDRASDFADRKDTIGQAVSALQAANDAVDAVDSTLRQLKGLLQSAKTASTTERAALQSQFNTLSAQMNQLFNDSSYQGLNLLNSSTSVLQVDFSTSSNARLSVAGKKPPGLVDIDRRPVHVARRRCRKLPGQHHHRPRRRQHHLYGGRRQQFRSGYRPYRRCDHQPALDRGAAGLQRHLPEHQAGILHQVHQLAGDRSRQADPGRYQRGRRQPGGPADPAAAGPAGAVPSRARTSARSSRSSARQGRSQARQGRPGQGAGFPFRPDPAQRGSKTVFFRRHPAGRDRRSSRPPSRIISAIRPRTCRARPSGSLVCAVAKAAAFAAPCAR